MRSRSRRTPAGIPVTMTVSCGPCDSPALTKRKRDMGVDLIARAAAKEAALRPPTKENRPGGLRRAGAAGSAGWPSLNARLSPESPVSRPHVLRQALPAVPARRRPLRRLSVGRLKACCLDLLARRHSQILLRADEDLIRGHVVDHGGVRVDRRAGIDAQREVLRIRQVDDAAEVAGDAALLLREGLQRQRVLTEQRSVGAAQLEAH